MYSSIFEIMLSSSGMCKYCVFAIMSSLFILFQLCCYLRPCEIVFRVKCEMIGWWFKSFSSFEFTLQFIKHCTNQEDAKIKLIIIVYLYSSQVIILDNISNYKSISLIISTRLFIMQCLIRYLALSYQK